MTGAFSPREFHMETASGRYVDLAGPDPASITLHDIAHHLSLIARYTGATVRHSTGEPVHYSVAEHSYLVAQRLRAVGHPPLVQLAGLHHDDMEAFTNDIGRPMKRLIEQRAPGLVKEIEASTQAAIVEALELEAVSFDDPAVKDADTWALAAEAHQLLPSRGIGWFCEGLYDPDDLASNPFIWTFGVGSVGAKVLWLLHHRTLTQEILVARAREILAFVLRPEGIDPWLTGAKTRFGGERPIDLLERGGADAERVLGVIESMRDGSFS